MKSKIYVVAALVVGVALGAIIQSRVVTSKPSIKINQATSSPSAMVAMKHEQLEVSNKQLAPTVKLHVEKDPKSGYNIHVVTTNFKFSPELVGKENVDNKGHAHLYVDDVKVARLYSEWFHLDNLKHGKNIIKVTLNSNGHQEYSVDGQTIEDSVEVDVTDGDTTPHTH